MATTSTVETAPLAALVEDLELYPRHAVDGQHVTDMVRALESGRELPPIIADRGSKRIVDGFHRRRAYQRFLGADGVVPVEWRTYANESELFVDAVQRNSGHGRKLDRQDQIRVTLLGQRLGLADAVVARVLRVDEERVEELRTRVVLVKGEPEPAKRAAAHLYGQAVTEAQAEALQHAPGTSVLYQIHQVAALVRERLFDASDDEVLKALRELHNLIHAAVKAG